MKIDFSNLKSQLQDFGLNPGEWVIEAISSLGELTRFEIRPFEGGQAFFEGWADRSRWISVGLVEI